MVIRNARLSSILHPRLLPTIQKMAALFSVYAIFSSTFLNIAFAWLYCITRWVTKLFTKTDLSQILDIKREPSKAPSPATKGLAKPFEL